MNKRFRIASIVLAVVSLIGVSACKDNEVSLKDTFELDCFVDGMTADGTYDSQYYYRNDLTVFGGDADVIWVSEEDSEEYGGWFYLYTSGNDGVVLQQYSDHRAAVTCLRSRDLNDWELCGAVEDGFSIWVDNDEWILSRTWAPEVLRNPTDGKYYMYVNATGPWHTEEDVNNEFVPMSVNYTDSFYGAVLVSDVPVGPFRLATSENYYNGEPNPNGKILTKMTPQINVRNHFGFEEVFSTIDYSPFLTSNGDLYMYFVRHASEGGSGHSGNCMWGMKMKDWVTPDYDTLTKIGEKNYETVLLNDENAPRWNENSYTLKGYFKDANGDIREGYDDERNINEGPQMYEHEGRYYLCYSPRGYANNQYDVKQAIGDSPLGPFTKLPTDYARVFGTNLDKNHAMDGMTGTGHHAFVEVEDELFCVYYVHADPMNGLSSTWDGRIYAVDRLSFVDTEAYGTLIYGNGPTKTLQPKPNVTTGLHNVLLDGATITATNAKESTIQYLSDGRFVCHDIFSYLQFESTGATTITIKFDTPKTISAMSIYNSYEFDYAFSAIDSIVFDLSEKPAWYPSDVEYRSSAAIKDVMFNERYIDRTNSFIYAGAACNLSFDEITVNSIKITISKKIVEGDATIKVSDIVVLGK